MRRALELAARGPEADDNPRVGCVLLGADGHTIAEGWHGGAGTPHAEAMALASAGERARGATAVVTLEPCNHTGRTGPCAHALIAAGIARVVFATADPNPTATGGAATLQAAGIDVASGPCASEATLLNRTWLHRARTGRPFVTWKFATTLDGRSAAADGSSRWITGPAMRSAMARRRAACGAVLVGTGTVVADDPRLTARDADDVLLPQQPLRVVMGERDIAAAARVRGDDGRFRHLRTRDPRAALATLAREGVHHVWLEGGPTVAAAFWRAGVVDEVIACLAPALLGAGPAAVADLGIASMVDIRRLRLADVERHGDDVALICRPTKEV